MFYDGNFVVRWLMCSLDYDDFFGIIKIIFKKIEIKVDKDLFKEENWFGVGWFR